MRISGLRAERAGIELLEYLAPRGGRLAPKDSRANDLWHWQTTLSTDQQADLTVHSGASKGVYAYPAEHYEFWRKELPDFDFPRGRFW